MSTNTIESVQAQIQLKRYMLIWGLSVFATLSVVLGTNWHFGYNLAKTAEIFEMAIMLTVAMAVIDIGRVVSAYYHEISAQRAVAGLQRQTEQSKLYRMLYIGGTAVSIVIFVASILNLADVSMHKASSASVVTQSAQRLLDSTNDSITGNSKYAGVNVATEQAKLDKLNADFSAFMGSPAKNMGGKDSGYSVAASLSVHPFYKKQYGAEIANWESKIAAVQARIDGASAYSGSLQTSKLAADNYRQTAKEEGEAGSFLSGLTSTVNWLLGLLGLSITEFFVFAVVAVAIYSLNEMFLRLSITNLAHGAVEMSGIDPVNTKANVADIAEAAKLARQFGMFQGGGEYQPVAFVPQPDYAKAAKLEAMKMREQILRRASELQAQRKAAVSPVSETVSPVSETVSPVSETVSPVSETRRDEPTSLVYRAIADDIDGGVLTELKPSHICPTYNVSKAQLYRWMPLLRDRLTSL